MRIRNERGFSLGELFIALVVIMAIGFGGVKVAQNINKADEKKQATAETGNQQAEPVTWQFDNDTNTWKATGTPPACPDPVLRSPVDMPQAVAKLYPGQYRGFNYKPHGALGFASNSVNVYAPLDGRLTGLVRYIEGEAIQYKVTVENECGIAYYFDHLHTLSEKVQAVAETTPEPKIDDTRSMPLDDPIDIKQGDLIATVVGHPKTGNKGMDFGVIDYRTPNEISKNATWAALHKDYNASEWFGVCWFDMLPAQDVALVKSLPLTNSKGDISDYCTEAAKTTLQANGGKPTNG